MNINNQCKHEKVSFEIIIENIDLYYGFLVITPTLLYGVIAEILRNQSTVIQQ